MPPGSPPSQARRRGGDIAICGAACRLPSGTSSPDELWKLLVERRDAVGTIPSSRWGPDEYFHPYRDGRIEPGTSYTWSAGVVEGIEDFDPAFFGISPREAEQMDPQQRLMLELAWECLEDAGIPPSGLAGSPTGVYVGVSLNDYSTIRLGDHRTVDPYFMTGTALSIVSNRVSYVLDLHGPSLSVDTACSSSLVALHLACQAIRAGEVPRAIVGGVNALLTPFPFLGFSAAGMLSPDGRCRSFDADAKGYVRSEGGVALVLEPLEAAAAAGRRILAVVRATGVNSDGRKNGIALPNHRAQADLLRKVYLEAGIDPADVCFVEAHGTGTPVGDPLELEAIGGFFASHRSVDDPLPVGSIKSNVGHLESGAGLAGVLKAALFLQHRTLLPGLHCKLPNPRIPFDALRLRVLTEARSLPADRPGVIGVNSFGFGGTNAHVVLGPAPAEPAASPPGAVGALPALHLSARGTEALRLAAGSYAALLEGIDPGRYYDVAYALRHGRDLHPHRLRIEGATPAQVRERLEAFAAGRPGPGAVPGVALPQGSGLALMFSGNGSQWAGMGTGLLATEPAFRDAVHALDRHFAPAAGWSIVEELTRPPAESGLARTEVAQPCLLAVQVGLVGLLRAWGVEPEAVVGHSVGEVAAAWASGALRLEDAAALIHRRSVAQGATRGLGRMAAVGLSVPEAEAAILPYQGAVELACSNGPRSVTLAGPRAHLEDLGKRLGPDGTFFRLLDLDYAFHSRVLDPVRSGLLAALPPLAPQATRIPFVSSVEAGLLEGPALGRDYWWENLRRPVRFAEALEVLVGRGVRGFVEVGPHPILAPFVRDLATARSVRLESIPLMDRRVPEAETLARARGALFAFRDALPAGPELPRPGRFVDLPRYRFVRARYGYDPSSEAGSSTRRSREHPLLGYRRAPGETAWEGRISPELFPYLADHRVGEGAVFPGAGFVELALAAGSLHDWNGARSFRAVQCVEDLQIHQPMRLEAGTLRVTRLVATADDGRFSIESRAPLAGGEWIRHATGRLVGGYGEAGTRETVPDPQGRSLFRSADHYRAAAALGLRFGPAFQGVDRVLVDGREAWGWIRPARELGIDPAGYRIHPAQLDAGLQVLLELAGQVPGGVAKAHIPVQFERVVHREGGEPAVSHVVLRRTGPRSLVADYRMLDADGLVRLEIDGCRLQAVDLAGPAPGELPFLDFTLEPRQLRGPGYRTGLPGAGPAVAASEAALEAAATRADRGSFFRYASPLVDAAAASATHAALLALGPGALDGPLEDLGVRTALAPAGRTFVAAMIPVLLRAGAAVPGPVGTRLVRAPELAPFPEIWRALLAAFPGYAGAWSLLGRVGRHLPGLLAGQTDLDGLLAPASGEAGPDAGPTHSPASDLLDEALVRTLVPLVSGRGAGRLLRILELGSRGPGLAAALREAAPAGEFDYVLTSPDRARVEELDRRAAGTPGLRAFHLEPSALPAAAAGAFDVVVAPDGLHLVPDLSGCLAAVRALLAADGLLLVGEQGPDRWDDLVHGLRPARHGGPAGPRRAPVASWTEALERRGFGPVRSAREPGAPGAAGVFLLVAERGDAAPVAAPVPAPAPPPGTWVVLRDVGGPGREVADRVVAGLGPRAARLILVEPGIPDGRPAADTWRVAPGDPASFAALGAELAGGPPPAGVVHLMGFETGRGPEPADPVAFQSLRISSLLHLLAVLPPAAAGGPTRVVLVTGGALAGATPRPSQSPLLGFGRVLANERSELRVHHVDLSDGPLPALADALLRELLEPDDEDEVAIVGGTRLVPRLRETAVPVAPGPAGGASNETLALGGRGLAGLAWQPSTRRAPGPGEVEIEVRAVGLNFRDVMWAMGLLPEEALEDGFAGPSLGLECAGTVAAVGPGVAEVAPGDRVLGYAAACFSRFVTTRIHAVRKIPEGLGFEEAATVAGAFFTAWYSLEHLARIGKGERVLIHGGAGGVGLAAIQVARRAGCEIFATVGSGEKRDFLGLLGVEHVLDSRSLSFARDVLALTGGAGVDVVLNSLAGEAMQKGLAVLRPFGRFVELGKRDFFGNTRIGLRPFRRNLSYFGVDADQLFSHQPELARRLLGEVLGLLAEGGLRPLAHRVFPRRDVVEAFRHLQASRHIGKVVVSMAAPPLAPAAPPPAAAGEVRRAPFPLRPDASYLVVGGTGGFGLATARFLAARGARHLALLSRRGAASDEAREAVARLEAQGTTVRVLAADVADRVAMDAAFAEIRTRMPPLRGVVHSAMVLDDAVLGRMDQARLERVLAPKVEGARILDAATRGRGLDFFVMYTSATTLFGNPGQANYVAANAYLEGLARSRRVAGEHALAIGWGGLVDAGVLTRKPDLRRHLEHRVGDAGLTAAEALARLEAALAADLTTCFVSRLDWARVDRLLHLSRRPRFRDLVGGAARAGGDPAAGAVLLDRLRDLEPAAREGALLEHVRGRVAGILQWPLERIDPDASTVDLGLDSLMAVELKTTLERDLEQPIAAGTLAHAGTLRALARSLGTRLEVGASPPGEAPPGPAPQDRAALAGLAARHGIELPAELVDEVLSNASRDLPRAVD